jgi:hypothetical protein
MTWQDAQAFTDFVPSMTVAVVLIVAVMGSTNKPTKSNQWYVPREIRLRYT